MPSSNAHPGRWLTGLVLALANVLLFATWPWLNSERWTSNTADPFFRVVDGKTHLQSGALLRNPAYLEWFLDAVRRERMIWMLGTSESGWPFNLAAQLNVVAPENPRMALVAAGGCSSIHTSVTFARCQVDGIQIPPTILLLNLVYYMGSHDVVNEGWLGKTIPTPVFLFMNDGNVRAGLSDEVNAVYDAHFRHLRPLYPLWVQQYASNLLYLRFHQEWSGPPRPAHVPYPIYAFDGKRPRYDEARAVWPGYVASDRYAKSRWIVNEPDEALNLKGLRSIMAILDKQPAPVLLVILPVNRKFYEFNRMDMPVFDERLGEIRARIRAFARGEHVFVADLYAEPPLDAGFVDRMHHDGYGFNQLARYLCSSSPAFDGFLEAVRAYYAAMPEE